jgi:hypothetical protein
MFNVFQNKCLWFCNLLRRFFCSSVYILKMITRLYFYHDNLITFIGKFSFTYRSWHFLTGQNTYFTNLHNFKGIGLMWKIKWEMSICVVRTNTCFTMNWFLTRLGICHGHLSSVINFQTSNIYSVSLNHSWGVYFQSYVWWPSQPIKMATITIYRKWG